jgi:serine/threonine-protein kinase
LWYDPKTVQTCPQCNVRYPDALEVCPQDGAELPAARGRTQALFDRFIGTVVDGRYKIEAKLGEGGMGVVYAARHAIIDKRMAIKILKKEVQDDEAAAQRFIQEARATSKIGHTNIVDITDFGVLPDGSAYFVMEFLEGETLGETIAKGPLAPVRAISVAAQIARGLGAAHKHGIVHRDLKPENVFLLDREGQHDFVKIVDFGIAKVQSANAGQRLTAVGMVLGTPEYMSPEQATGKDADHRVDEYALGCILYEMLTGEVPFRGETSAQTLAQQVFDKVVPPRERRPDLDIPRGTEAVVLKAMAKEPDQRYPSMRELLEALDQAGAELGGAKAGVRRTGRDPEHDHVTVTVAARQRRRSTDGPLPAIPRNRLASPMVLVVGGAVFLAGVGGWLALGHRESAAPEAGGAATRMHDPAPPQPPAQQQQQAAAAPVAPPPSSTVTLLLKTVPAGGEVSCEGALVGVAPVGYRHERSSRAVQCSFKLAGYRDAAREFMPDGDREVEVALLPRPHPARAAARAPAREPAPAPSRSAAAPAAAKGKGKARRADPVSDLRDPFQ